MADTSTKQADSQATELSLTEEAERLRRQRSRSLAIAVALVGLVVLFYIATLVKFIGSAAEKAGS